MSWLQEMTTFITLGTIAVVAAVVGGKSFFKKIGESLEGK